MRTKNNTISTRRLHIDRKMVGILSLFAILGICLVVIIVIATHTMSALRAYSTLQTHWTEQRKEASHVLTEYLQTRNPSRLEEFYASYAFIERLKRVRAELFKDDTDRDLVRQYLLQAQIQPADVEDMIVTFKRFHSFSDFARAVDAWIASDRLMEEMRQVAREAESLVSESALASADRQELANRIRDLDDRLTEQQYELASALSDGTGFLTRVILWISLSLGVILLFIGTMFSVRFLKSIQQWRRDIEYSEQRYKSLYERNPNAVFSISEEGRIVQGNGAMKEMTGYGDGELKELEVARLFDAEERKKLTLFLEKASEGDPQSFETRWLKKNGDLLPVHVTYLPIYVDDKIVGVFGMAEDISYQKHAEKRIKKQLEEKTFLLSEIHDRVKNNLALISGMIELQKDQLDDESAVAHLESTKSRIHSMAIVHERLYQMESFASIRMDEYIRELVSSLEQSFGIKRSRYTLTLDTDEITMGIRRAVPCGLLLNELIVNVFKYVLRESDDGELTVRLKKRNNNKIYLQIKDNGSGMGPDFDLEQQETLGMTMINLLIKQLDISAEINTGEGTEFNLWLDEDLPVLKSA